MLLGCRSQVYKEASTDPLPSWCSPGDDSCHMRSLCTRQPAGNMLVGDMAFRQCIFDSVCSMHCTSR